MENDTSHPVYPGIRKLTLTDSSLAWKRVRRLTLKEGLLEMNDISQGRKHKKIYRAVLQTLNRTNIALSVL